MSIFFTFFRQHSKLTHGLLWLVAIACTLFCFAYQDKTGPTYPLEGSIQTALGSVSYHCLRSETIGNHLNIILPGPMPEGITAFVKYRRYKSHDAWQTRPMNSGTFSYTRRGRTQRLTGTGVSLPSLKKRAGKYEYKVYINDGLNTLSITGDQSIYARYKGRVPGWALTLHILAVFVSMMLAIRTTLAAWLNHEFKRLLWAALLSLLAGGFVLGPLVQWYAFGVLWSGVPFGYDWTDNKVLVELIFWLIAMYLNRGNRRNRSSVLLAGILTLFVYFIPHSLFGSEFDYQKGSGHGTAG